MRTVGVPNSSRSNVPDMLVFLGVPSSPFSGLQEIPVMRAVIYARYSSDRQREASIEDQVRTCRA